MIDESKLIDMLIDKYSETVRMLVQSEELVARLVKENESLRNKNSECRRKCNHVKYKRNNICTK